jgi:hypothetical protein
MEDDDLPPQPAAERDGGFSGALGGTVSRFLWVAVFVALAGAILYALTHWA